MLTIVRRSLVFLVPAMVVCQSPVVDFRFAPSQYFAAACFPNDWLKTVVTQSHGLGYDFGPGPYATPLTEVTVRAAGETLAVVRQQCADPVIPVFTATLASPGLTSTQKALSVPLGRMAVTGKGGSGVQRLLGWTGTIGWARPGQQVDPAFSNVAWGVNRPILYRVPVRRGGEKLVALGVCEPYKKGPGMRVMEFRVEGDAPRVFDPLSVGAQNQPHVLFFHGTDADQDGFLTIEARAALASPDPNPVLSGFWLFPADAKVTASDVLSGKSSKDAELTFRCGVEEESWQRELRADMLFSTFAGRAVSPDVSIRSSRQLQFDSTFRILTWEGTPFVVCRPDPHRAYLSNGVWHLVLPRGTAKVDVAVLHGPWTVKALGRIPGEEKALAATQKFWRKDIRLPHGHITVPDTGIQYLLDGSVRNLYQNSELVDGGLEFHPGPSVYRGLWVHDAAWHISALLYLGDAMSAKLALDRLLKFQLPSGQLQVMAPYIMNRESPIVAYTMVRYARMTGDREWLKRHWDQLQRMLAWTEQRRAETLSDRASPAYGLFPPGFADGGLGGVGLEYASVFWALAGFHAGVEAAHWVSDTEAVKHWQQQYDGLLASFRNAARRDMRKNSSGHWYLPMKVAESSRDVPPQQANWAILDAQGLAHLFSLDDSLVTGTLAMLGDSTSEGLPISTGWLRNGVWPFFGSLLGITQTYQRDYDAADDVLYAVANHASPLGSWVEEQLPKALGTRTSGDCSDATSSALFIKQVRRLLIMERGDTLELLAGVPSPWIAPGKTITLHDCPVEGGGRIHLTLSVDPLGHKATVTFARVGKGTVPGCVLLNLRALNSAGYSPDRGGSLAQPIRIDRGQQYTLTVVR